MFDFLAAKILSLASFCKVKKVKMQYELLFCVGLIRFTNFGYCWASNATGEFTSGNNDIRAGHRRGNVMVKRWLHKLAVLFENSCDFSAPLTDVSLHSSCQSDV